MEGREEIERGKQAEQQAEKANQQPAASEDNDQLRDGATQTQTAAIVEPAPKDQPRSRKDGDEQQEEIEAEV